MNTRKTFCRAGHFRRHSIWALPLTAACVFAVLFCMAATVVASFTGTLKISGPPLSVEVTTNSGNAGSTAVRVTYLSKKSQTVDFGTVPAGGGSNVVDQQPLPRGTKLVIVEIDPPVGGTALLRVSQGVAAQYEDQVLSDGRFVYEVID